jgi:hypothetical protein
VYTVALKRQLFCFSQKTTTDSPIRQLAENAQIIINIILLQIRNTIIYQLKPSTVLNFLFSHQRLKNGIRWIINLSR